MLAECDCQPQIEARYHTVPFGHADSYALEMLAQVLNGRTGRLYKSMVEGKEIASSAFAQHSTASFGAPAKYEGYFSFSARTKGEATPEDLEAAWYEELTRLQEEPVGDRELQKVKNGIAADSYRRLQNNFFLLLQLGMLENLGDWRHINENPRRLAEVTPADIQRVAQTYFEPTNRTVGIYHRKAGTGGPEDPELAAALEGLPPQAAEGLKQQIKMVEQMDEATLSQMLQQAEMQAGQVPAQFKKAFDYLVDKARVRLESLQSEKEG